MILSLNLRDCLKIDKVDRHCYLFGDQPRQVFREAFGRDATQAEIDNLTQNVILPNGKSWIDSEYADAKSFLQGTFTGDPATDAIIAAQGEANQKFSAKIKEFDAKNPFVFDKILQEEVQKVGTRLDPYYKQTLDDFLKGIQTRTSRSLEDERRTLTDISQDVDAYKKETQINLEDALSRSREGYADVGQYFSGQQLRTTAKVGLESGQQEQEYLRGQGQRTEEAGLTRGRDIQDIGEGQRTFQRDVGQYNPEGVFARGARSEAEVRSFSYPEVERRRSQREFEMRQYVSPAVAGTGINPALFDIESYSLLR